jgi:Domain of unknown function (DUF4395)
MRASQTRFIRQLGFSGQDFHDSLYSALMFQPRTIGVLIVLGVLLQSPWFFLVLSAVLLWSAFVPARNPFDAVYNSLVAHPRGLPPLGVAPEPRRFAQGLAGTFVLAIAAALFAGASTAAWALEGLFAVAMMAVVFGDSCAGAALYHVLRRRLSGTQDSGPTAPRQSPMPQA